jgi:succinate-semialdehyde dehydrogenase/glutarate-semialdehyde dehydrogenase
VTKGMPAFDEEVFGPVAAVVPVKDKEQAIEMANDSAFGLGGGVFTRDLARGEQIAAELIDSGMVFVNEHMSSDPRLPFGGTKESGYGRELSPLRHKRVRQHQNRLRRLRRQYGEGLIKICAD